MTGKHFGNTTTLVNQYDMRLSRRVETVSQTTCQKSQYVETDD